MDFFDSVINDIAGVKEPEKGFFETAFDDILGEDNHVEESVDDFSDDDDLVTEKISISGSIAATLLFRLIGSAFRKTSTSIKVSVKINPALKNYEKANSDVIPFKDLVKKSVSTKSIADDDSDDAKKVKKMLAGATSVDFYFKSKEEAQAGENPIIAFTFTKASNPVTGSGSKSASIFQVSSEAKNHLEYYFNAYLTKHGMVGDPKLNAWVDEWGKNKDDGTVNEDVDDLEMDFDLGSEFFSESSVTNLIMAPLSKLRSNMAKHSLKRNAGASKRFAEKYKKNILCDGNVAEIEKLFLDLTNEVEGFLNKCDSAESSSFYKETNAALKEAVQKFYGSVNRTKRTEYNPVKLNDEILRSNDVVTNACNKIARIVEGLRNKDLDPDAARAVSKCLSTVDSAGSTVFSKYRKFMSKYHPDIIKMDAEAKAYSTGVAAGTVAAKY